MIKQKLKRVTLRAILLLASILAVSQSGFASLRSGGTVYVQTGNYDAAEIGIRFLGTTNPNMVLMEKVSDKLYKAVIPSGTYTQCVITRGDTNQGKPALTNPWNTTTIDLPAANDDSDMAVFEDWNGAVGKFHWATYNAYGLDKDVRVVGVNNEWSTYTTLSAGTTTYSTDIEISAVTNGNCYFRIKVDGSEYTPGSDTQITLDTAVSLGSNTGTNGAWYFPATTGEKYTFTVNKDANSVTVTKTGNTPAAAPTFRINWDDKYTPTIESTTTSAPYSYSYAIEGYKSNNWLRVVGVSSPNAGVTYGPTADTILKPEEVSNLALTRTSQKILSVDTDGHIGNLTVNFTCSATGAVTITSVDFESTQAPDPTEGVQFVLSNTGGSNNGNFTKTHVLGNTYEYTLEMTPLPSGWWINLMKVDGTDKTWYSPASANDNINSLPYSFTGFGSFTSASDSHCFVMQNGQDVKISFKYDESSASNLPYDFKIEKLDEHFTEKTVKLIGKFDGSANKTVNMTFTGNEVVPEYVYTVSDLMSATGEIVFYVDVDGTKYYSEDAEGGEWNNSPIKTIQLFVEQRMVSDTNTSNRWRVALNNKFNVTVHVRPEQGTLWVTYDEKYVDYDKLGIIGDEELFGTYFDVENAVWLTKQDGTITYEIDPQVTGNFKFAFVTEDLQKYILAKDERQVTLSGVDYEEVSDPNMDKTFSYMFNKGKKYTLTIDGSTVKIAEQQIEVPQGSHIVKINGLDGTWGRGNYVEAAWDEELGMYICDYTCSKVTMVNGQAQVRFRINVDAVEYQPASATSAVALGSPYRYSQEGSQNYWWFNACKDGTFRIRVNPDTKTFRVLQLPCNHEGEVHTIAALTGLAEAWTAADLKVMTGTSETEAVDATHSKTVTTWTRLHSAVNDDITFRVRLGGVEYTPGANTQQTVPVGEWVNVDFDAAHEVAEANLLKNDPAVGYFVVNSTPQMRYRIIVEQNTESEIDPEIGPDGYNHVISQTSTYRMMVVEEGMAPLTSWAIPVVPERITNRYDRAEWAEKLTAENPAVFLMANILNGERVNPEWEMTKGEDGKYHLNGFVMRSTTDGAENKAYVQIYTSVDDNNPTKDCLKTDVKLEYGNGWSQALAKTPGMICNATYDPAAHTLTFTPDNDAYQATIGGVTYSVPPFLALVGSDFTTYTEDGLGYTTPRGRNTEDGWQESRLLFNANGDVELDTRGNVMYSTLYPPKYPSYFEIDVNGQKIEVRTTNIRFNSTVDEAGKMLVMTGAEWKEWLKTNHPGTAYNNLFASTDFKDAELYARLVVRDVWTLGSFKLWTGWNGNSKLDDNSQAEWTYHMNFGYGDIKDNNNGSAIEVGKPYVFFDNGGNVRFGEPQYFKTVEYYYALTADGLSNQDAGLQRSIFYTTQGYGSPSIAAKSVNDEHKVATFQLRVQDMPAGSKVTGIQVVRYNSQTDKPCDKNGTTVSDDDIEAAVALQQGSLSYTGAQFNTSYSYNQTTGNRITVDTELANGRYYYVLNISFQTEAGETAYESVASGIVTIVNTNLTTRPRVYQLVKNVDQDLICSFTHQPYDYVTFSEEAGRKIYGLNYRKDNDPDTPSYGAYVNYEEITSLNTEAKKQAYYLNPARSKWTDQVFVFCELPTELKTLTEGVDYEIAPYELGELGSGDVEVIAAQKLRVYDPTKIDELTTARLPEMHNSYAAIIRFTDLLANNTVTVNPHIWFLDSNGNPFAEEAEYTARAATLTYAFPVPDITSQKYLVEAASLQSNVKAHLAADDEMEEDEDVSGLAHEHEFSIELGMSGVNVETTDLFNKVYPHLEAKVQMLYGDDARNLTKFYVTRRAHSYDEDDDTESNAIVIKGLDPNDFVEMTDNAIVGKDGIAIGLDANFPDNVNLNAYPAKPGVTKIALKPEVSIAAPEVSLNAAAGHVYRRIVPVGENLFEEQLVLAKMKVEHVANTLGDEGELRADNSMQVALKGHGAPLGGSRVHSLASVIDPDYVLVLDRSEQFHWYAEMNSDLVNAPRTSKTANVSTAYVYYFKYQPQYDGTGLISFDNGVNADEPALAKMMAKGVNPKSNAAPMRKAVAADDTHSVLLSPYAEATTAGQDIMTSVEGISMDLDVTAGNGWLEANGDNVQVYNAAGMLVAGAGRSELPAGIYVVRVDGKTVKVSVR